MAKQQTDFKFFKIKLFNVDMFLKYYPGPLAPPFNKRPSRNITALLITNLFFYLKIKKKLNRQI